MLIFYGSPSYFFNIFIAALVVVAVYFALKNAAPQTQNSVLFTLAAINIVQHFFKPFVWPHLRGTEFSFIQTAYNVCAFLIIATPFTYLLKSPSFRSFVWSVGSVAGILPLIAPQWFIGQTPFQWEFCRSFVCHVLLLTTSLLPFLRRKIRLTERYALSSALLFFAMLFVIFLDNIICIQTGLLPRGAEESLWDAMLRVNPFWMMGPSPVFAEAGKFLAGFSFGVTCGTLPYVPVLWYFLPIFSLIYLTSALLGRLCDKKFVEKMKIYPKNSVDFVKKIAVKAPNEKIILSYH